MHGHDRHNRTVLSLLYNMSTAFILVFNQLDAQNLFHNKFYFIPLHVSSTCAHHQEVEIALHSLWYHHTYRCDYTASGIITPIGVITQPLVSSHL